MVKVKILGKCEAGKISLVMQLLRGNLLDYFSRVIFFYIVDIKKMEN
jgi:hypothetical protein